MHLDNQIVESVRTQPVAGWNKRSGAVLGDDRWTEERIARAKSLTIVDWSVVNFGVEVDGFAGCDRLAPIAVRDRLSGRIEGFAGSYHANANVHDFHFMLIFGKAITAAVQIAKCSE